jgi:hypothetical protein
MAVVDTTGGRLACSGSRTSCPAIEQPLKCVESLITRGRAKLRPKVCLKLAGNCPIRARPCQSVRVHYTGWLDQNG